ncbi:lysophospholipid acyltransferase family protein [Acidihalobacter ferrooxydans]|uniref:1-acyl-sn-glycerol-3-phosphate acyltransferase n=1 Tax=Acidihalobacter ferrooxydans TaxID=1765967 RepID=A0A1P8UDS2_9GAMM|nr:lysophospholipid acyltransferase family protein [Acidihalobacter ferrooxydans]APZ42012.1 1-acyl-sn-glycerol-3-phosphate acyltransferase [Acidihalobacter ferrooxydans]
MNRLRAWLWAIIAAVATLPFVIGGLLLWPVTGFMPRYRFITLWTRFVVWLLGPLCGIRYRVEGQENIPPRASIIMSKHQSGWETFAFQSIFPPQTWVLKRELLRMPLLGWGLRMIEPIAIDRSKGQQAGQQLIEQGGDRLRRGIWIVIFPEGTRAAVGEHKRFKTGAARLAAHTGVPIVPVAHNAGLCWPRKSLPLYPGTVTVSIGPPIETQGRSAEAINAEAEAWIKARTAELETLIDD